MESIERSREENEGTNEEGEKKTSADGVGQKGTTGADKRREMRETQSTVKAKVGLTTN